MALTDVKSEQIQSSVALAGSPTTTTQSASDNSTKIATTAYVETAVANLVASAPAALNTLDELAAALNDDASFSTTITNSIATKLPLAGGALTGNLTTSGKIGIGTSTINADSVLHLKSTQPNIYFEDTDDSKSWRLEAGSVFKVQNITTSTEAFRVKQNGAFGIGTAPTDFFDLLGSVSTYDIGADNAAEVVANFVPDSSSNRNGRFRIAGTTTPHNHSIALISDSSSSVGMSFVTTDGGTRGERVVIDSAGNVGIGTTSPAQSLHVSSTGTTSNGIRISNSEGSFETRVDGGEFYLYDVDDTRIPFLIDTSGNVGIGDTTPQALLDVGGGYGGNTSVATFAHATDAYIEIENMTTQNGAGIILTNAGTKKWTIQKDTSAHGLYIQDASTNANMTFLQGGNVGIGTTSPTHSLHVISTDNKGFLLDRNTGNEPASLNEFSSYYSLSIKNRAGGTYLNFGGGTSGTRIQATDGAGSATAKTITLNPYGGNVGIGTSSPLKKLDILGESSGYDQIMIRSVGGNNTTRSGGITGINYSGNQLALMNYYTDSGQTYLTLGSMGSSSFRGPTMIRAFTAGQNGTTHTEALRITDKFIFASGGSARNADVALEVNGPLKITNNTNAGVSQTHTNMTAGNSGKLIMNFHSIGTMTTGDTIVFTYAATSWKSWFFKIRWSSTGGYIGELWAGGYNNNSDGYQILNPRYYAAGSGDGATNTTVEGATLSVSRSGQANTMTLTLNNNHVHPLFEIEYSCGGGEGYPNSSKASITVNS